MRRKETELEPLKFQSTSNNAHALARSRAKAFVLEFASATVSPLSWLIWRNPRHVTASLPAVESIDPLAIPMHRLNERDFSLPFWKRATRPRGITPLEQPIFVFIDEDRDTSHFSQALIYQKNYRQFHRLYWLQKICVFPWLSFLFGIRNMMNTAIKIYQVWIRRQFFEWGSTLWGTKFGKANHSYFY